MPKLYIKKIKRRVLQTCIELVTHRCFSFPPELKNLSDIDASLKTIATRWPSVAASESDQSRPVFIFSAGWRSGSTLLQRLICSSGEIVIWGEPLCDAAIIPRMAKSLTLLSGDWPHDSYFTQYQDIESFSENWIANVTPSIESLRLAHRAFYDKWLADSARDAYNTSLWGVKQVDLTIEHARYLKWIYPNARFVFIYRDLTDAYLSWRGNTWASAWPKYFSWSPVIFARHWKLLLSGYLTGCNGVDGYLVKYEDLISGKLDLKELSDYVGINHIDSSVLEVRIASPDKNNQKREKRWISPIEKILLILIAGKLMRKVGYRG